MMMSNGIGMGGGQFGDTTLTKVFVGGLAWETQKETMKEHFDKYGDILEAVIISDKLTGRSKGYGFVTFKEPEAAKKACEDATPLINGRRANCNLASLGARRPPRSASTTPPLHGTIHNMGPRSATTPPLTAPASHVQWYYPTAAPGAAVQASPYHHHHHQQHQAVPYYGYSPAYIATDHVNYNHKLSYNGGSYMNGHYPHVYMGQPTMAANTLMPMYHLYHYQQQPQTMGLPAHIFSATAASAPISIVPTLISKPTPLPPKPGAVGEVEALKRVTPST